MGSARLAFRKGNAKGFSRKGKLLEDGKTRSLAVKKGERILFSKYAGPEVKIGGEEYLIICEDDVLGVIQD
jgi:chaperonin GroES